MCIAAEPASTLTAVVKPPYLRAGAGRYKDFRLHHRGEGLAAMTSVLQEAATLGLSVLVAAGDNLVTDSVTDGKAHVDLPAVLTALVNRQAGKPAGCVLPFPYRHTALLRDFTQGTNKPSGSEVGYSAAAGWDACTGLGVPDSAALISAFALAKKEKV